MRRPRPSARHRHIACLAAVCLLLLVAVPGVSAQRIAFETVTVEMAPERFDVRLEGSILEGSDADELRGDIDEGHGDADGQVTTDEVATYVEAKKQQYNDQLGFFGPELTKGVLVDDRTPTSIAITDILLDGAVGAVASNTSIVRDFHAELVFTETAHERVNVTFKQDFRKTLPTMSFDTATFRAAAPWHIDAATITPGGADNPFYGNGTFTVAYSDMDEFSDTDRPLSFDLTKEVAKPQGNDGKDDRSFLPAPPMLLGVLVLAAVAGMARRLVHRD